MAGLGSVNVYNSAGSLIGNFSTIQAAVDYAGSISGSAKTIVVDGAANPPFAEQVTVNGAGAVATALDGLTIKGINGAILQAPSSALVSTATDPNGGRDLDGVLTIENATGVTIEGLTVDGATKGANLANGQNNASEVGIAVVNSTGTVVGVDGAANAVTVENVRESDAGFGDQRGLGIYVSNSAASDTVTIDNTTVENFQKNGITVKNADATIHNDTVIGTVTGLTAQNGIEIGGSTGVVAHNTISDIGYTKDDGLYNASGILAFDNTNLSIDSNQITLGGKFTSGIFAYGDTQAQSDVSVTNNTIVGGGATGNISAPNYNDGIYYTEGTGGSVSGNTLSNFDVGIEVGTTPGSAPTSPPAINANTFGSGIGSAFFQGDDSSSPAAKSVAASSSFGPGPGQVYVEDSSGNVIIDSVFSSIQAAIDAATSGDRIAVGAGTYDENVTVNKSGLTIVGQGDSTIINGSFLTDNNITGGTTVDQFLQTAAGYSGASGSGITIDASNTSISGVKIQNFLHGVELGDGISTTDLTDVDITNTVIGINKATTAGIDGLTITDGSISDGYNGIEFDKNTTAAQSGAGNADNVTISGTDFSNLDDKGIYAETLSNGTITGVSMTDVGQFGRAPSFGGANANTGNGIDLNLKNGTYSGDLIDGFTLTNVGASNAGNPATTAGVNSGAIVVEARNDGATYSAAPATYNGTLTIENGTIGGTSTGIQVGEPGKSNTGPAVIVSGVSITGADNTSGTHGDVGNDSTATLTVNVGTGPQTVKADPTSTGRITFATGTGSDSISGGAGLDTVTGYSASATVAFTNGHWTVTDGGKTDILTDVDKVVIGNVTHELVDQSGTGGYQTIQSALNGAGAGDVVNVAAGTYNEGLSITQGVTIDGAQAGVADTGSRGAETVITGQSSINTGANVTIDGVEFLDATALSNPLSISDQFVSLTVGSSAGHDTIENSTFDRAPTGDTLSNSTTFVGSAKQPTHRGLEISSVGASGDVDVEGNLFTGNNTYGYAGDDWRSEVYSNGGVGTTEISGNTFANGRSAINADNFSSTVTIDNNVFSNPASAISLGVGSDATNITSITNNTFGRVDTDLNVTNLATAVSFNAAATGNTVSLAGESFEVDPSLAGGTYTGTAQSNTIGYENFNGGFDIDLKAGTATGTTMTGTTTLINFQNAIGGSGNDTLTGDGVSSVLDGGGGLNTVDYAGATAANLSVVSGNWTVSGAGGTDTLHNIQSVSDENGHHILLVGDGGYTTIQAAIDAAQDGDTIDVTAGTYNESLNIDKAVTIDGANAGIGGSGQRGSETIITGQSEITTSGQVTVNGVEFLDQQAYTLSASDSFVGLTVDVNSTAGDIIENSVFDRAPTADPGGFNATTFVGSSSQPTHRGLVIASVAAGQAITVENNLFTGSDPYSYAGDDFRSGIYSNGGAGTTDITGNTFKNVRSAVNADGFSSAVSIDQNTFVSDGTGISLGVGSDATNITSVTGNTFGNVDTALNTTNVTTPVSFDATATGNSATGEPFYVDGGTGGGTLKGTAGADVLQSTGGTTTFVHTAGSDELIGTANSIDTATGYSPSATLAFNGTNWTVTDGANVDTLVGVDKVVIGGTTVDLVAAGGTNGFTTVQSAVDAASDGDTIMLAAGTYAGTVTVSNKTLNFAGAKAGSLGTAVGRGTGESAIEGQVLVTGSKAVSFDGVEFLADNTTGTTLQNPALRFGGGGTYSVVNSLFYSSVTGGGTNGTTGILLDTSVTGRVTINGNAFAGASAGLFSTASWSRGIWSDGASSGLSITGNTFNATRTALNLDGYNDATHTVSGNTFATAGSGISIGLPTGSSFAGIHNNDFETVGDTFNFQNVTTAVNIDLSSTQNASAGGKTITIDAGLAGGTIKGTTGANIFNGGAGNDIFYGGAAADGIKASAGNDTYFGEGSAATAPNALGTNSDVDTVVYASVAADYTVSDNADGSVTITKLAAAAEGTGTDQLHGIENIVFSGQTDDLTATYQVFGADGTTLVGTSATIAGAIGEAGADDTIVSTSGVSITVAQAQSLETKGASVSAPTVTLTDTAAAIDSLAASQIVALTFIGTTGITSTDASVALTTAKVAALEASGLKVTVPNGDAVTVSDTAAHIGALTPAQIAAMAAAGVTAVASSNASLTLSAAQAAAFDIAGITLGAPVGDTVTVSDTAANIQTSLAGLEVMPANVSAINVGNAAAGGIVKVSTATFDADKSALNEITQKFEILDTGAHILGDLTALSADLAHISAIVQSDAGGVGGSAAPVTVNVAGFEANTAALNELSTGFDVEDNATDLLNGLDDLELDQAHIAAIITDGAPVAAGVAKFVADQQVLDKIGAGFNVTDQSSNIQTITNLDALEKDAANIGTITALTGKVTVSVSTFGRDMDALNEIAGGFAISDTAANIKAALPALLTDVAHISSITTGTGVGGPGPVTVSVLQFTTDQTVLDEDVSGFAISDTAANIAQGLTALNGDIGHITSITSTSGTVTAPSVATFLADEAALNKVAGGFNIMGAGGGISAYVYALEADVANINAITATSGTVTASVAAFTANETVLNEVVGNFAISDTGANITAGLAALEADQAHISSITATSGTVTAPSIATFLADETALNKVAGGFNIMGAGGGISAYVYTLEADQTHINAITATSGTVTASVAAFMANETVLNKVAGGFVVSDTGANIAANIDALEADAANISSITATSGTVTASSIATFLADETALNKVAGGFNIMGAGGGISAYVYTLEADQTHINAITATSGTVTASVAAFTANETVLNKVAGNFAIADTAANIAQGLTALEADQSHIGSVTFTDATPPTLNLTQAQATSDASLLAKIAGSYVLNVANSNGSTTTTGHGTAALTINAASTGPDTITGDSGADAFIFKPAFGQDIITNFNATDTITLPASEFGSFATLLMTQSGGDTIITNAHNADTLTLTGITATNLTTGEFKFA